jgi:aspartyl-tRNA(Asn)/glutamyl-tRNA(Gln) amidotransferase subunit B
MEIVSEPEIDSAEEAVAYLNSLRQILVYSGVSDADMEKGQMRCDVNISVRKKAEDPLGTKIELKNLNSVSVVRKSIHYEIERQTGELEKGNQLVQATWRWNDDVGQTEEMRTKENADDYRYFPDPDLLPVKTEAMVADVQAHLPELPHEKVERFEDVYGITHYDASVLASEIDLATYFEKAAEGAKVRPDGGPKKIANWVINNLLGELKEHDLEISECPVAPEKIGKLVGLIEAGTISNNQAKEVFTDLFASPGKDPAKIAKEKGFEPADTGEIEGFIDQVIAENPGPASEVAEGNSKAANFLTGQVMKLSRGKANPKMVTETIIAKLQ